MTKQVKVQVGAAKIKVQHTESRTLVPEPMKIIREREKDVLAMPEPYRVPQQSPQAIHDAAKAYATFDCSDPFAYGRMYLHLSRGLELASTVLGEFRSKVRVRQIAKTLTPKGA